VITAVAATIALQLAAHFPGEPFLHYSIAVVASARVLGRTAGFVAVAGTSIAYLLYFYSDIYPLTHTIDLPAITIYAVIAARRGERGADPSTGSL
jgi:predicted signal transduction protein with EAL and GGDEF domain